MTLKIKNKKQNQKLKQEKQLFPLHPLKPPQNCRIKMHFLSESIPCTVIYCSEFSLRRLLPIAICNSASFQKPSHRSIDLWRRGIPSFPLSRKRRIVF